MQTTRNRQPIQDTYDVFVEGQVVKLKTGGPDMTVTGYCEDCGGVTVAWFNFCDEYGWTFFDEEFPSEALVSVH